MKVLRVFSGMQRSPNEFIPVHKHLRQRARKEMTIWNLPEEVMVVLLKNLHIKDLLNMQCVHPYFRTLLDNNTSLWSSASFQDTWPSMPTLHHFEKTANFGNIEALVKLAVAYLYNEGLPGDLEGRKVTRNGIKAAEIFCKIESLTTNTDPFTWLFIRPPWSVNGACCKECVFNYMTEHLKTVNDRKIQVCVAKTLQLLDDDSREQELTEYLETAANQRSGIAAFMLWNQRKSHLLAGDKAGELDCIRNLRDIALLDHLDAKLELCRYYAVCKYGGISRTKAMSFVRDFVHSIPPLNTQESFKKSQELTASMRYILVDWLAEVSGMKEFSSHTLHVAVSVVDRYLRVHPTSRSKLQLLGVAAMVLCSRFLGKDIITIREAAWLTDNTYKYEDVVRMMGEITATLQGSIRVATSIDFAEIFNTMAGHDQRQCCLSHYICELALLQAEMGQYSQAETAASAVLLSRLLLKLESPWPTQLQEATGFSIEDLSRCAFHMHEKCFLEGSVVDHRDVILQAVKLRYADEQNYGVSEIEIISYQELCTMLGVTEQIPQGTDIRVKFRNEDELIVSPSRRKRRKHSRLNPEVQNESRETTATPSLEASCLNESAMSGYDGDQEDEEESYFDQNESQEELKKELFIDEGMGSESDTYFVSLSNGGSSPRNISPNLSFSQSSPGINQCLSFTNQSIFCDRNSTSGISSSPNSHHHDNDGDDDQDSPSTSGSQSFSLFSSLKLTSMTLRSASSVGCSPLSSDSDTNCDMEVGGVVGSKRKRSSSISTRHMTLRDTTKRKTRRQHISGAKTYIFK